MWTAGAAPARAQAVERVIYASVLDAAGKPVTEVRIGDVAVREDGVAREVLRIAPATDPMEIALLVDNSAASANEIVNLRDAIESFTAAVAGTHAVSIVGLADRPTLLADTTNDKLALKRGVGRLFTQSNSGMYLLDGIVEAAKGFRKRQAARPVIVSVTTDGVEFSNLRHQQVLEALADAGAAYHAIILTRTGSDQSSDEARERNMVLDRGTREFGGSRKELLTGMAVKEAMLALAEQLTKQVKVTFARPQSLIPPQRTTIESTVPGMTVRGALARIYGAGSAR